MTTSLDSPSSVPIELPAGPTGRRAREALLWVEIVTLPANLPLAPAIQEVLLSHYSGRLRACLRAGDTLNLISTNRIAISCPGIGEWAPLSRLLSRLQRATNPPLPLPGHDGYCTLSITTGFVEDAAKRLRALRESAGG